MDPTGVSPLGIGGSGCPLVGAPGVARRWEQYLRPQAQGSFQSRGVLPSPRPPPQPTGPGCRATPCLEMLMVALLPRGGGTTPSACPHLPHLLASAPLRVRPFQSASSPRLRLCSLPGPEVLVHVHTHTHTHTHTYSPSRKNAHIPTHVHTNTLTHAHKYNHITFTHKPMHTYSHTQLHRHAKAHKCIVTHKCACRHIYTCTANTLDTWSIMQTNLYT